MYKYANLIMCPVEKICLNATKYQLCTFNYLKFLHDINNLAAKITLDVHAQIPSE